MGRFTYTNENIKYDINYEVEDEYNHEEDGQDDYCRCRYIVNVKVEPDLVSAVNFIDRFYEVSPDTDNSLEKVLVERLLSHSWEPDDFEYEKSPGYYGEELDSIFLANKSVLEHFEKFSNNTERLEKWLECEYGNLLPEVVNQNWTMKKVPISDVVDNTHKKLFNKVLDKLVSSEFNKKQNKYIHSQKYWMADAKYEKYFAPLCVPAKDPGKYRLIDGRHRFFAWQQPVVSYKNYNERQEKFNSETWIILPK